MKVIGLTGGIGSGKSAVARLLSERGAVVVDADAVTHELQQPGQPVFRATVDRFGPGVVAADGTLDRQALADLVFADRTALAELEAITHPAVASLIAERVSAHAGGDDVVVLDVALLVESGRYAVAGVVVVDCPEDVAMRRLVEGRDMTEADVRARMDRQASRADRLARADHVVGNGGSWAELGRGVDRVWRWIDALA